MVKLEDFKVGEIKKMVSKYNKQVKIGPISKLNKTQLIEHIRKHPKLKKTIKKKNQKKSQNILKNTKKPTQRPKKTIKKKNRNLKKTIKENELANL